jgi:hypothetical protein
MELKYTSSVARPGSWGACPHEKKGDVVSAALGKIQVLPIGIVEKRNAAMIKYTGSKCNPFWKRLFSCS